MRPATIDRQQDGRWHAVARCRGVRLAADLLQPFLAKRDALRRHDAVDIVPDGARELRLRAIEFDDPRQVPDIIERVAQRGIGNARRASSITQRGDPLGESLPQLVFVGDRGYRRGASG